ncbi:Asp23/Gls24 family envelope stress response protein [Weissella coleopterorum]|uniref:Asp23/Gls24 family envelope stress response protein n=1 Tax=Weissella coleopterorum TaxID=2714949 RepID=A0A6G8B1C7_9LACO|nr:Asp23/Gls24 family envelope stress response protein [Weissella coleopterorum]QIL51040.1 Asp23/Gls24 family envelope stress response protein [Weissella coleopterorum]
MAAEETILLTQTENGSTRVNIRVLDIIAGLATREVEGVARLRGTFGERAKEVLGYKDQHGTGISTNQDAEGNLQIEVYVDLNYGVAVPKVAHMIQTQIKTQMHAMLGIDVPTVDVHVIGVLSEKLESEIDPNNLFGDEQVEEDNK